MGIEGLNIFVAKQFNGVTERVTPNTNLSTDHIYIDINNYLHKSIRKDSKEIELDVFKTLKVALDIILRKVRVRNTVFLGVDGPSPKSKSHTQRERRFRNSNIDKLIYYINKNKTQQLQQILQHEYDYVSEDDKFDTSFSSLCFTPGTEFMGLLKQFLIFYTKKLYFARNIFISSADRQGEGEFKIFEHIASSNYSQDDTITIVSSDSDILLFSLLSKYKNVIVYNKDSNEIVNIEKFREKIYRQTGQSQQENGRQPIVDFVILSFMLGTDHFPKVSSYNISVAWSQYCRLKKPLYNETTQLMDMDVLKAILSVSSSPALYILSNGNANGSKITKLKSKFGIAAGYYCLSKGLPPPTSHHFKIEADPTTKNRINIYLEDQIIDSSNSIEYLITSFLSETHPFWVQNIGIIKEKYIYKLYNIFSSVKPGGISWDVDDNSGSSGDVDNTVPFSNEQLLNHYLYGLQWHLNYFSGRCNDFNFSFPLKNVVSSDVFNAANGNSQDYSSIVKTLLPPAPLLFGFCLIDFSNKHLFPQCYHSLYRELPHFNILDTKRMEKEFQKPESYQIVQNAFNSKTDLSSLSPYQKTQLEFSPTLFLNVLPNKTVELYEEQLIDNGIGSGDGNQQQYKFINSFKNNFFDSELKIRSVSDFSGVLSNLYNQPKQPQKHQPYNNNNNHGISHQQPQRYQPYKNVNINNNNNNYQPPQQAGSNGINYNNNNNNNNNNQPQRSQYKNNNYQPFRQFQQNHQPYQQPPQQYQNQQQLEEQAQLQYKQHLQEYQNINRQQPPQQNQHQQQFDRNNNNNVYRKQKQQQQNQIQPQQNIIQPQDQPNNINIKRPLAPKQPKQPKAPKQPKQQQQQQQSQQSQQSHHQHHQHQPINEDENIHSNKKRKEF